MVKKVLIRKATKKDIESVFILYKEVYSEKPYNEDWDNKNLSIKMNDMFNWMKIFIAEIDKEIVGFVFCYDYIWDKEKRGSIEDLGVKKEFRRKSIGEKLFKRAEQELKKLGVKRIWLDVNKKAPAMNLYKKIGYKVNGYVKMEKKI